MGFAGVDLLSGGGPDYAGIATSQEEQRKQAVQSGTYKINQAFAGFDPAFYKQRQQDYVNYAMPQLSQQYQTNKNQVGFGLANRGIMGGSSANKQFGDLNVANAQAQQGIADLGITQSQQLQQQVEGQRNQLLGQLYQTADPAGAGQGATQAAAGFAVPNTWQPLANQFQNFANTYYLSQLINAYKPSGAAAPYGGAPQYGGNPSAIPGPSVSVPGGGY